MDIKIIYEDNDLLVIDKPAGIVVFNEQKTANKEQSLIDIIIDKYPELKNTGEPSRYGIIHRLDKDTSGILLVAKNNESLIFLQKQFKNRRVEKRYIALVNGKIKNSEGTIETLIGRAPSNKIKQKAYLPLGPKKEGKRLAITKYKKLEEFEDYTLIEVKIETGRRHQIRCHLAYIQHPIAGDKLYGFKNQPCPKGLNRQFLHASYLKIQLPNGQIKEFKSDLPDDLKKILIDL